LRRPKLPNNEVVALEEGEEEEEAEEEASRLLYFRVDCIPLHSL
jgi:hypothetical protein